MLFYQLLLLAGYIYAHMVTRRWSIRGQLAIHGTLLLTPFIVFALGPPHWPAPDADHAVQWLLSYLLVSVGLPFFILSTNAPLVQRWFADSSVKDAKNAYFLYSASNLGSLCALVSYPTLIEPHLSLGHQYIFLVCLYAAFALTMMAIVIKTWKIAGANKSEVVSEEISQALQTDKKTAWKQRLNWMFLAFIPSSLMLSVTTYITSNVAPCPLFWVVPLALYLLSFVFAFSPWTIINRVLLSYIHALLLVLLATVFFWTKVEFSFLFMFPLHLTTFFIIALMCHMKLADSRPDPRRLTEFYLCLAVGGALGGTFNAIVAPAVFKTLFEYPAVLALSCFARTTLGPTGERGRWRYGSAMLAAALLSIVIVYQWSRNWPAEWLDNRVIALLTPAAFICLAASTEPLFMMLIVSSIFLVGASTWKSDAVFQGRNTLGTLTVVNDKDGAHFLAHGNTLHGAEDMREPRPHTPISYYHEDSPIAHVFYAFDAKWKHANIAVVGLGCGTIAAYAQPGQSWTFYEINPMMLKIASEEKLFTYYADCKATHQVIIGDGRQALARARDGEYDMITFDAFSSDAIPVHLLTREALQLYLSKLAPGGVLVFHISSRTVDLKPTLRELAKDANLACLLEVSGTNLKWSKEHKLSSTWMVMARTENDLAPLKEKSAFAPPDPNQKASLWTDDFSNLLETLRLN